MEIVDGEKTPQLEGLIALAEVVELVRSPPSRLPSGTCNPVPGHLTPSSDFHITHVDTQTDRQIF